MNYNTSMWKRISDFIEENKDTYNDFYSELSDFNEALNYLRHHKKSRNSSIKKLIIAAVLGVPSLIVGLIGGIALPITIVLGILLGGISIESLINIIKYKKVHDQAGISSANAYDLKVAIEAKEKAFKIELIQSITEDDCKLSNLNSVRSRLIDLEYYKDELKKQPRSKITQMSLYNEIELTEFLLKNLNTLAPYANLSKQENETNKQISQSHELNSSNHDKDVDLTI